jgi:dihydrofolate reductase
MRKIIVAAFVSVDGVMQAPGGPDEDPTGGFTFGGWTHPLWDDQGRAAMGELFERPFDLLLGRKTYDIFAAHWPFVPVEPTAPGYEPFNAAIAQRFNALTKYVATHRPESLVWQNSEALGSDVVARLRVLKAGDGPALLTQGSSELLQTLFAHDLVDELRTLTFPLLLGRGKRLFGGTALPAALELSQSASTPSGIVISRYQRGGAVKTGSFALEQPTPAELERRKNLK